MEWNALFCMWDKLLQFNLLELNIEEDFCYSNLVVQFFFLINLQSIKTFGTAWLHRTIGIPLKPLLFSPISARNPIQVTQSVTASFGSSLTLSYYNLAPKRSSSRRRKHHSRLIPHRVTFGASSERFTFAVTGLTEAEHCFMYIKAPARKCVPEWCLS